MRTLVRIQEGLKSSLQTNFIVRDIQEGLKSSLQTNFIVRDRPDKILLLTHDFLSLAERLNSRDRVLRHCIYFSSGIEPPNPKAD